MPVGVSAGVALPGTWRRATLGFEPCSLDCLVLLLLAEAHRSDQAGFCVRPQSCLAFMRVQDGLVRYCLAPHWFSKGLTLQMIVCVFLFSLPVVSAPQFQLIE